MARILLTGAGFSRNWGGWLASEAFEYLIGSPRIDAQLRSRLWKDRKEIGGFEHTLGDLQAKAKSDQNSMHMLENLLGALRDMFLEMNHGFSNLKIGFLEEAHIRLVEFLRRFDAIFTLNQDLLLEHIYMNPAAFSVSNRNSWKACVSPGVKREISELPPYPCNLNLLQHIADDDNFCIPEGVQPYFKLHGSSNWFTGDTKNELLVMGGGKEIEIERHNLLTWYYTKFKYYLSQSDSRLMIIGFSFNDPHVETPIKQAIKTNGLRLFIIDPRGVDVFDKTPATAQIHYPASDDWWPGIEGASRRSLLSIFAEDTVEYAKLQRFVEAN